MSNALSALKDVFAEMYEVGCLPIALKKKYRLICRYEDKVSQRLLIEKAAIREEGKRCLSKHLRDLMGRPNPFLAVVSTDESNDGT